MQLLFVRPVWVISPRFACTSVELSACTQWCTDIPVLAHWVVIVVFYEVLYYLHCVCVCVCVGACACVRECVHGCV